ncbi:hypothetical protein PILCRDRAFT_74638, partial [Piloderma croceum F 1598]
VGTDTSILTCKIEPNKSEHVAEILQLVKIGDDISPEEQSAVEDTIKDFVDVFILLVSEVKHIPEAVHHFEIPEGATFNTKIHQLPMTPPQTAYFLNALDIMLKTGVCAPIAAKDVKCVSH